MTNSTYAMVEFLFNRGDFGMEIRYKNRAFYLNDVRVLFS
jgi:hypothetical protein